MMREYITVDGKEIVIDRAKVTWRHFCDRCGSPVDEVPGTSGRGDGRMLVNLRVQRLGSARNHDHHLQFELCPACAYPIAIGDLVALKLDEMDETEEVPT